MMHSSGRSLSKREEDQMSIHFVKEMKMYKLEEGLME